MQVIASPVLRTLFRVQDSVRQRLGIQSGVPTEPPMLPGLQATRGGGWGYLPSRRGEMLFYRYWLPADVMSQKAAVIAIHGVGAHGQHFWVLGQNLAARGFSTYALDLRGHGYSEGPRGDLSDMAAVVDGILDLAHFLVGGCKGRPVFVLGESFGANLVMMAAARGDPSISGIILSGTALEPTETATGGSLAATAAAYIRYLPYLLFDSQARVVDITGREERVSRDPEEVRRSKTDPLRNNVQSPRTFAEIYLVIGQSYDIARKVHVPSLLLQGGHDLVTEPSAVWRLRDALGTDETAVVIFPEAYHGLFFDPDTPKVLDTIADWLDKRVQSPAGAAG